MSAVGFRSLYMAAGVATAALGCYLVSLNVASERAKLEAVESEIAMTQRDIRVLQTEIGTRGRLAQLERWNVNFVRLSAPTADQFLEGGYQLATLVKPQQRPTLEAPMVLAAAPAPQPSERAAPASDTAIAPLRPDEMMHVASYARPQPRTAQPATEKLAAQKPAASKPAPLNPASAKSAKPEAKSASKSAAKGAKTAMADPLSPLPTASASAKAPAGKAAAKPKSSPSKDPEARQ